MMNRILITGGAGFIGSHLVDYYLDLGAEVVVIDDLSTGKLENISAHNNNPKFTFFHADILEFRALKQVLRNVDLVFNMAAMVGMFNVIEHPIKTLKTNVMILEKILIAMEPLKKKPTVVVASSSEVYGSSINPMKESNSIVIESTAKNQSSYVVSKLYNEIEAMAYHKEKNYPVIIVRIFNTTGTRQTGRYGMVVPRFIKQAMQNKPLTIFGDGQQTRSFCSVKRLCAQLHALTEKPESIGKIINIGNRQDISILELAKLVKKITGSSSALVFKKFKDVYGEDSLGILHRKPDLKQVEKIVGYPCHWDITESIEAIYEHHEELSTRFKL